MAKKDKRFTITIDLEDEFTVDASTMRSKSRNTPFDGWQLKGRAALTMVAGKVVFSSEQL